MTIVGGMAAIFILNLAIELIKEFASAYFSFAFSDAQDLTARCRTAWCPIHVPIAELTAVCSQPTSDKLRLLMLCKKGLERRNYTLA